MYCHYAGFWWSHVFSQRSRPGCVETGDFVQLLGGNGIDTSKLLPITDLCISFTGPSEYTPLSVLSRHQNLLFELTPSNTCFFPPLQLTWRSAVITRWWGWCPVGSLSVECLSATGYWTARNCRRSRSTMWKTSASITDPNRFIKKHICKQFLLNYFIKNEISIWQVPFDETGCWKHKDIKIWV